MEETTLRHRWRSRVDPFIVLLILTVALSASIPLNADAATVARVAAVGAVCILFFLHGARLSISSMANGFKQWRIHALVLTTSFVLFPALGIAAMALVPWALSHTLWVALFFLTALPSTVQSSIAFVSAAHGNVSAAVLSATFSNLTGIVITPLLAALVIGTGVAITGHGVAVIAGELLLPFGLGLTMHRLLGGPLERHPTVTAVVDRGSVLMLVYAAFGASVAEGLWRLVPPSSMALVVLVDMGLLATALALTWLVARLVGLAPSDQIVVMFCGSKKGLSNGVAMASVLFAPLQAGIAVVPLMIYHLIQLVVCAAIARRWGRAHNDVGLVSARPRSVHIGARTRSGHPQ